MNRPEWDVDGMWHRRASRWVDSINSWSDWLLASGASRGTVRVRRWYLRRFAEDHIGQSPWRVDTNQITTWMVSHRWGAETLKNARSSMRSFYGWAHSTGRTDHDPTVRLPAVRVPRPPPRPATEAVFRSALAAADDRVRLMILLARRAGLRDREIASLPMWRVTEATDTGRLTVLGKGGRTRTIPLADDLHAALRTELALRERGTSGSGYRYRTGLDRWLFPGTRNNGPMRSDSVGRVISRALGPHATAHQLRHSFATRAYAGTRDLRAVQELLGHERPETTARYTALPDDAMFEAVRAAAF